MSWSLRSIQIYTPVSGLRSVPDSAPAADVAIRSTSASRSLSDIAAAVDAAGASSRACSDNAPAVDTVVRSITQIRSITLRTVVFGVIRRQWENLGYHPDILGLKIRSKAPSLADVAHATDAVARPQQLLVSDSAPAADTAAPVKSPSSRAITDIASAIDSAVRTRVLTRQTVDAAPGVDTPIRSLLAVRPITDTAPAADAVNGGTLRPVTDSGPAVDSTSRGPLGRGRPATDAAVAADTVTRAVTGTRFRVDIASATDATSSVTTTVRVVVDSAPAAEATTRAPLSRARTLTDTAAATDVALSGGGVQRSISDSAPAAEATTRVSVRTRLVIDVAPAADIATRGGASATGTDTAPALDIVLRTVIMTRFITDTATSVDSTPSAGVRPGSMTPVYRTSTVIDFADPVPLTIQTRDIAGNLSDAGSVTLTIGLPDGVTTVAPTLSHPSTGTYQVYYQPTQAGRHTVSWVASGANTSGYTDVFDVSSIALNAIISLQDARSALRLTATTEDEDLRPYVEAATSIIERHLNQVVVRRTIVEDHRIGNSGPGNYAGGYYGGNANTYLTSYYNRDIASYANSVVLRQSPVIALTSVVSLDGLRTWNVTDLHLDPNTGLVTPLPAAATLWGPLVITYVAGRSVIPAHYQQAARMIVHHLWAGRRGDQNERGRAQRAGDVRWSVAESGPGMQEALELLGPPLPSIA